MPDLSYITALGHVACLAHAKERRSRLGFSRWLDGQDFATGRASDLWAICGRSVGDLWAFYVRCRNG
jgi:hypothetical protein